MTTYFISRHPGAVAWARRQGFPIDRVIGHLDPEILAPGDFVLGTLPVHLAAAVCARGARYFHLSLALPAEWRGRELSDEELGALGARLQEYRIEGITDTVGSGVKPP